MEHLQRTFKAVASVFMFQKSQFGPLAKAAKKSKKATKAMTKRLEFDIAKVTKKADKKIAMMGKVIKMQSEEAKKIHDKEQARSKAQAQREYALQDEIDDIEKDSNAAFNKVNAEAEHRFGRMQEDV